jgi:hypothetical protein
LRHLIDKLGGNSPFRWDTLSSAYVELLFLLKQKTVYLPTLNVTQKTVLFI